MEAGMGDDISLSLSLSPVSRIVHKLQVHELYNIIVKYFGIDFVLFSILKILVQVSFKYICKFTFAPSSLWYAIRENIICVIFKFQLKPGRRCSHLLK